VSDIVTPLVDGIAGLPLWALALAVAVTVACESSLLVGLVVPGDLVVLLAAAGGTGGSSSLLRALVLVAAITLGSVAGEALGYLIGRRWGDVVRCTRAGRALGDERWARAGGFVERHGARAVFGARYVAAVHAVLPVVAGTLRMPLRRFLGWSTAGAASWAMVYVAVGALAGASVRQAGEHMAQATLVVVGALLVLAALVAARSRRTTRVAAATGAFTPVAAGSPAAAAGESGGVGVRAAAAALAPPAALTPCGQCPDRDVGPGPGTDLRRYHDLAA
jgi:membrane-associated protein